MPRESREAVEKRVLEAEKVVVSSMLNRWRKEHGMDYVILVRNGPGDVFVRTRVSDAGTADVYKALEEELAELKP